MLVDTVDKVFYTGEMAKIKFYVSFSLRTLEQLQIVRFLYNCIFDVRNEIKLIIANLYIVFFIPLPNNMFQLMGTQTLTFYKAFLVIIRTFIEYVISHNIII